MTLKLIKLLLACVFVFCLYESSIWYLTDGFCTKNVQSNKEQWEEGALEPNEKIALDQILTQNFHYLDKGTQVYVFVSDDQKYVLKLFQHQRVRPRFYESYFNLPPFLTQIYAKKNNTRKQKLLLFEQSCRLAYNLLAEESGLIHLHLNKRVEIPKQTTLFDKLHRPIDLDLNQCTFYIQKKADLIYPTLARLMQTCETEKAKRAVSSLVELLQRRLGKGVFDLDTALKKNTGLLANEAICMDVGQLKLAECSNPKSEIIKNTSELHQWLAKNYPELSEHLILQISKIKI